jgi:ABC-type multidrug transport system fused ATPase/permease subunit
VNRARLRDLIRVEQPRVIASLIVAAVGGLLLYPTLWLVRELFDSVIPSGDVVLALLACAGILVARIAAAEAGLWQRILAMRAAKGAAAHRRRELLQWLLRSDVGSIERLDPGLVQSRLVHETERVDVMLNRAFSVAVPAMISALLAFGAMTVLEWRLAILTLVLGIPVAWMVGRGGSRTTAATRVFQEGYERYTSAVRFVVRHLMLVRSRGHVDEEQARQGETIDGLRDVGIEMALAFVRQGRRLTISVTVVAVAVLALGSFLVVEGDLTVGALAAFYVSAVVCGNAVGMVGGAVPDLKGGLVAVDRLAGLLVEVPTSPPRVDASISLAVPPSVLPVRLSGVDFAYGDRLVLSGVDLELEAGRHVDLRGANGAGKSTVIRLVLGLERPGAGTMTAGGVPVDDLDRELLRRRIGYAPQKPTFFSGTVLENLLYGRPGATLADAERAVALAGVAEVIEGLEGGFDASLGEDGSQLSGGEGQRLAIARALVGDPELVVLDEPGNHLPSDAAAELVARLRRARPEIALLTAGHGHSDLDVADLTLRLDGGRLREVKPRG